MSEDDSPIVPSSAIIEFGFLVGALIIIPAFNMAYEMANQELYHAKIEHLGWGYVMGSIGLSIVSLSIGSYIFVKKIIFALIKIRRLEKNYKKDIDNV